jgi:hypothetical protein
MILLDFLGMDISGWLSGTGSIGVVGIIVIILRKRGYIMSVKFWSKKLEIITHKIGKAFLETSDVFGEMDGAIKDNGRLKENSVKELIAEGREAVLAWKDVIITIKPKPKK